MSGRDKKTPPDADGSSLVPGAEAVGARAALTGPSERHRLLSTSITGSVLPELVRRVRDGGLHHFPRLDGEELDRCVAWLLDDDHRSFVALQDMITELARHDMPVFSSIFCPIAERLGRMWQQDSASFFDITLGSSRLQTIIRESLAGGAGRDPENDDAPRIFFARAGTDTHTLGLMIVCGCFREAGWEVHGGSEFEIGREVLHELASTRFVALGLSLGPAWKTTQLDRLVREARTASRNPAIKVIVGGLAAADAGEAIADWGVDWALNDPVEALRRVNEVIEA